MQALTTVYRIRQHTARRLKHFQQQTARHVPTMSAAETAAMARNHLPALRAAMLPELGKLASHVADKPGARDTELITHTTPAGNTWFVVLRVRQGVSSMAAMLTYRTADAAMHALHFNLAATERTPAIAHHYPAELLSVALRLSAFDGNLHEAAGRMLLHGYARPEAGRKFPLEDNGPLCTLRELGLRVVCAEVGHMITYYRAA